MRIKNRVLSLLLTLAMVVALFVPALAAPSSEDELDLTGSIILLHTNDVHGSIDGYAKIAAVKQAYEEMGAYVLLIDAGDFIQGSTAVSSSQGATAVELMNLAGYDLAVPGNHEFDYGYDALKARQGEADFPILAANITYNGAAAFDANAVFTAPDGTKIGIFGLTTPETATKAHPAKIRGVSFLSGQALYDCAQAQVNALTAQGCDIIVCVGHLGIDDESEGNRSIDVLEQVTGIDVFIDGHSHSTLEDISAATGGTCMVGETLLTSTGTAFASVGMVMVLPVLNYYGITAVSIPTDEVDVSDEAVAARAQAIQEEIDAEYGATFATTEVTLNGARDPGNRTEETNLGDLIADAILWYAKEQGDLPVDESKVIALTNGGGIRATIEAGDISKNDINTVLPFGNTVAYVTVSGQVLLEALEASTYCTPTAVGAFPQVSGIEFTVNTNIPYDQGELYPGSTYYAPESISRVTITSVNGQPFDPEATYMVVTNDFLAAGGDTYYAFSVSTSVDTGTAMDVVVMDYITEVLGGTVTAADYGQTKGRITVKTSPFSDVVPGSWYSQAVDYVATEGIFAGTSGTTFSPDMAMSRAMLVTVLYRMSGSDYTGTSTFEDVEEGWYSNAVAWAQANGLVNGRSSTVFDPDSPISRQEMAKVLYNYAQLMELDTTAQGDLTAFGDGGEVESWALEGMTWAVGEGLIAGLPGRVLSPAGTLTRAQAATILWRMGAGE